MSHFFLQPVSAFEKDRGDGDESESQMVGSHPFVGPREHASPTALIKCFEPKRKLNCFVLYALNFLITSLKDRRLSELAPAVQRNCVVLQDPAYSLKPRCTLTSFSGAFPAAARGKRIHPDFNSFL